MSDTQKHNSNPKDKYGLQELTQMQRAFCEYLVMNEGRTTNKDAALHAGYSPKRATVEASELMRLPYIQAYLTRRMNEGKVEKTAAFEAMIGKAQGIFIDRKEIVTRDLTAEDKMNRKEELIKQAQNMRRVNALIKE